MRIILNGGSQWMHLQDTTLLLEVVGSNLPLIPMFKVVLLESDRGVSYRAVSCRPCGCIDPAIQLDKVYWDAADRILNQWSMIASHPPI